MRRWLTIAVLTSIVSTTVYAESQFVVRPEVYAYLERAHKAYDKSQWKSAIEQLSKLQKRVRLTKHEQALALQTLGFVYAGQDKMAKAAQTLEKCLALNALPAATQHSIRYTLAQIYFAAQQYKKSVATYDKWIAEAANPTADALYAVAAAKYYAKQYKGAAQFAARAMQRSKKPKTEWIQLRLASLLEDKRYREAIPLQKMLTERDPKNRGHWRQLVSLYAQTKDPKRALAVHEIGYHAGIFTKAADITELATRMLSLGVPEKAARMLEEEMKAGRIETNRETTRLLADAWYQASDLKRAAAATRTAAKRAANGRLYVRLAQIELEREAFDAVVDAGNNAVKKGGLGDEAQVWLLIGIAHQRKGHADAARTAFRRAERVAKQEGTKKAARNWLQFLGG